MTVVMDRLARARGFFSEDTLDTPERLAALLDDPRAGFLPATHLEKNQALTVLDYVGTAGHPLGIHEGLQEIFDAQKETYLQPPNPDDKRAKDRIIAKNLNHAKILAQISVASVMHTFGDHLADAKSAHERLVTMRDVATTVLNPAVSVMEAMREQAVSNPLKTFAPLMRYRDVKKLLVTQQDPGFDPLSTQTVRLARRGQVAHSTSYEPGAPFNVARVAANKHVGSHYTSSNPQDKVADYLKFMIETTAIGDVREDCQPALDDALARGRFWRNVFGSIRYTYRDLAVQVENTALMGEG